MTDTIIESEIEILPYEEADTDVDHKAHIVNPPANTHIWQPGMEAQDIVDVARATRQEITALCGHKFVPLLNPEKFDICQTCMDIAGNIMREQGE